MCEELKVKYNGNAPRATINRLISALSAKHKNSNDVLMIDEVDPCSGFEDPDWSSTPITT